MISNSKVDYILSFLKIKKKNLGEIKEKYEKFEREMEVKLNKIIKLVKTIDSEDNKIKFKKFLQKYEIKNGFNKIKEYFDVLIKISMPDMASKEKNNENDNNDGDEDEDEEDLFQKQMDKETNLIKEEEKLRSEINVIFENEPKFLKYIEIYLNNYLSDHINNKKNQFSENIKKIIGNINSLKLTYYKLGKIVEVIDELKANQLNIREHFKNFIEINKNSLTKKKMKLGEDKEKVIEFTFDMFVEKLKHFIGNIEEKVDYFSQEPDEFMFRLFIFKIGLNFL